jgi:hypothetical protein
LENKLLLVKRVAYALAHAAHTACYLGIRSKQIQVDALLSETFTEPGDLHGHGQPATLQTGKRRQAYQGGGAKNHDFFFPYLLFYFLKKMTRF